MADLFITYEFIVGFNDVSQFVGEIVLVTG